MAVPASECLTAGEMWYAAAGAKGPDGSSPMPVVLATGERAVRQFPARGVSWRMTLIEMVGFTLLFGSGALLVVAFSRYIADSLGLAPAFIAFPLSLTLVILTQRRRGLQMVRWGVPVAAAVAVALLGGDVSWTTGLAAGWVGWFLWVVLLRVQGTPVPEPMAISIYEDTHTFWLENIGSVDLSPVCEFVHGVADAAGQAVYVAVMDIDGRHLGEPADTDRPRASTLRIGSQAIPTRRFEFGSDTVVWLSEGPEVMCRILSGHFVEDYWLHWAVVVDARDMLEVAQDLHRQRHPEQMGETVGPQRALALGNWDPGGFLAGGVSSDVWEVAVSRLEEMGGEVETGEAGPGG